MFTHKDITYKTIYVINCVGERNLRVSNGELMLEEIMSDKKKTLTKLPFQKILALFIIGHITITTPLIDKCKQFNVALVVMKPNLRPVFFWANSAEANYLLRKKQFQYSEDDLTVAKSLMYGKFKNQQRLLQKTRLKDSLTRQSLAVCEDAIQRVYSISDYEILMGTEGYVAKAFFLAYYQQFEWNGRQPRTKIDVLNATLDIGYTILFNLIESYARMFGFDVYVGVYHRLWFKRKSLICDLMEPFRCIIDNAIRNAFNRKQFKGDDFICIKNEYRLKYEENKKYTQYFFNALIPYKLGLFTYIQSYYRCFMRAAPSEAYPTFQI